MELTAAALAFRKDHLMSKSREDVKGCFCGSRVDEVVYTGYEQRYLHRSRYLSSSTDPATFILGLRSSPDL